MTRATGWHVELENPSTGHIFRPSVVGEPKRLPAVKGLPRIEIPVQRSEKWAADAFEEAPLRVWYDGEKQPVEELESVDIEEDRTVLIGVGGQELKDRVTIEYDTAEIHTAAEDLIANNTSYTPNVDAPQSDVDENVELASADTTTDLASHFSPAADKPVGVQNGAVRLLQSAWVFEEDIWTTVHANAAASGDQDNYNATSINDASLVGDTMEYSFTSDHDIPGDQFEIYWRIATKGGENPDASLDYAYPGFSIYLDGVELTRYVDDYSRHEHEWMWSQATSADEGGITTVNAGSHTLTFEVQQAGDSTKHSELFFDLIAGLDARYSYNFDNDNGNPYTFDNLSQYDNAYLDGPEEYPSGLEEPSDNHSTQKAVVGGRIETTAPDTSGAFRLGLSNDNGSTYATASNTAVFEHDFSDTGTSLRWKLRLDRYGSRTNATPKQGFQGQSVDAFTLSADLSDIPIISDRNYDASLQSVLQDLADKGDMLWEYRDDGTKTIEWTTAGVRQSEKAPDVSTYTVSKGTGKVYEKVVIHGAAIDQQKEAFTANHGTAVALNHDDVIPASEVVYSGDTVYTRGDDYAVDYRNGEITTKSSGTMTDGGSYRIDYRWKITGEAVADGVTTPNRTLVEEIPVITTQRTADQSARILVANTSTPVYEGEVTVPHSEAGWSVIEDIDFPDVPTGGQRVQIKSVESTPERTVVQFGSRESIDEVIDDITQRLSAVSSRV